MDRPDHPFAPFAVHMPDDCAEQGCFASAAEHPRALVLLVYPDGDIVLRQPG